MKTTVRGARGEAIAVAFLEKRGFEILHRNIRLSRLEIDIVCRDGATLVFVEVKHSLTAKYGHPATWIDQRKQEKLRLAAELYIEKFAVKDTDIRFDAVTISGGKIDYYPNAF
jgi:putative endonuclease